MKGAIAIYLKRAGLTLGPSLRRTRHSDLSVLKEFLLGFRPSFGFKAHNNFGGAVHYEYYQGKPVGFKLTKEELYTKAQMLAALRRDPLAKRLFASHPIKEKRKFVTLNGVRIGFTPDAHGMTSVEDLKTTRCRTFADFIRSAIEYGYFRQRETYIPALHVKGFPVKAYWIIGIQKQAPWTVFHVHTNQYVEACAYAKNELEFLLYFYKHYGNPNWKTR